MATKTTTAKTTTKTAATKTVEKVTEPVVEKVTETVVEKIEPKVEVIIEPEVEVKKEVKIEKQKKTFTDSDYILCRSVWTGGLNIIAQSGNVYRFKGYGSECEINYRDLVTLIRRSSEHVFLPRFVILDEDFLVDFPTVRKTYGEMYTMSDLEEILGLPVSQMSREIKKLPEATKDSMRTLIATQIANGKLDSIAKVRELSTIFDSDFNLLSDLFVK